MTSQLARSRAWSGIPDPPPAGLVTFTIPGVPERLNALLPMHWAERGREAKEWRRRVGLFAPKTARFRVPVVLLIQFYSPRAIADPDARSKYVVDGLCPPRLKRVKGRKAMRVDPAGYVLIDDSAEWIHQLRTESYRGTARTVISLWPDEAV